MDDFRERLSRRPQLAIGRRQSAPVCCGGAPSPPSPGLSYKIGAWWRLQQWRGRRRRSFSEVLVQRSLVLGDGALSTQPRRALEGLPSRTMRGRELPLVLLALVLCQAPRGPAAPVPEARETVLAKMYPRGNHWAVGHLMGKKSTGETPYVYKGGSLKQQLPEYILWEEAARNLLSLIEAKGTRSHQSPPRGAPGYSPVYLGFQD
ncbi:gastrin-releasing peptide [Hipposideros larvatus]